MKTGSGKWTRERDEYRTYFDIRLSLVTATEGKQKKEGKGVWPQIEGRLLKSERGAITSRNRKVI